MEKETKKQKKRAEKEGEVFYKAHPVAQPIGRVEYREHATSYTINRVLWRMLGVVEVILLARMIFAAFGADGGNIITATVYALSYPLVWFFFYLFNTLGRIEVTVPTFELETLAAMAFYYIVIYIITELISGLSSSE